MGNRVTETDQQWKAAKWAAMAAEREHEAGNMTRADLLTAQAWERWSWGLYIQALKVSSDAAVAR